MNVDKYEDWSCQVKTELGLMNMDKYEDWSHQVKTELRDKQLWDIVEGTDEPPKVKNDDPTFMAWSQKNAKALKVIKHSSKNQFYEAIRRISSAKIVWDTLWQEYADPSKVSYIGISSFLSKMHMVKHF